MNTAVKRSRETLSQKIDMVEGVTDRQSRGSRKGGLIIIDEEGHISDSHSTPKQCVMCTIMPDKDNDLMTCFTVFSCASVREDQVSDSLIK